MKKWVVMLFLALLLFGSVIGWNLIKQQKTAEYMANMPEPEFPVTVLDAKAGNWVPAIEAIGFIEPNQGVTISTEASGVINDIDFESGATVKKDQQLVALDSDVEMANLKSSQARLPAAEAKYIRYQGLYKKGSISKEAYDDAEASYLSLQADIESLKATIDRRHIKAPFDGVVGLRNVFLGQYIQPGTDVVRLEDTTLMKLRFTVPQTDISDIRLGQDVEIFVDAYPQTPFSGKISAIEPAVNYQSGLIQVQADIPNNEGQLRSGMFARAHIILPTVEEQITLPQTAITFTLYGDNVYILKTEKEMVTNIVNDPNMSDLDRLLSLFKDLPLETVEVEVTRAYASVVKAGERKGNIAHIIEGVKPGDKVVTSGQVRLSNGAKVRVVESDALNVPTETPML